tara:strand:+ start:152 stop:370 length:219 start_codon:yes stop_codon:yes gene_type:complete
MFKTIQKQRSDLEIMLDDLWKLHKSKIPFTEVMCPLCLRRMELAFRMDKLKNPIEGSIKIVREWQEEFRSNG